MNHHSPTGPDRTGFRAVRRLAAMLASVGAALFVLAPTALAQDDEFGFVDGAFFAKAHSPMQLPVPSGSGTTALAISNAPGGHSAWVSALRNAADVAQAGAHPDATTHFEIKDIGVDAPIKPVRELFVDAPPGFYGNPQAVPTCSMADFMDVPVQAGHPSAAARNCPKESQVGIVTGPACIFGCIITPIYKLEAPPDAPAAFGFSVYSPAVPIIITANVRTGGDYGLRVSPPSPPEWGLFTTSTVTLWGDPHDPVHDSHRWDTVNFRWGASVSTSAPRKAFLTNPTYCGDEPLPRTIRARPWEDPSGWVEDTYRGEVPTQGCDKLEFGTPEAPASLSAQPVTGSGDSPTGLEVDLRLPFTDKPDELARPTLRTTTVDLPEGMHVNPSAAGGLRACTEAEIGLDTTAAPRCPEASKIADIEVVTPLLTSNPRGEIYLAEQTRNPFGSLMAMYLHVQGSGVRVKIAGRVDRDPVTGQVSSSFEDNPQLPFTHMKLRFKSGPRAPLVTPRTCGTFTTKTQLTPWSYPHTGPAVQSNDPFAVSSGPGGKACPASLAARPFSPTLAAGSVNPVGGSASKFVARFTREDGEQEFDRIDVKTPVGFAASLRGVPYCPEAGIAQAIARDASGDGHVERMSPSCPAASRVGTTQVGVGAGSSPFFASGDVYLAGPYKGAPLSLVFIVPAVAGPFDLGVQVVRAAVHVDRRTAQVTTLSDEIPKILEGVPLRVRDIRVNIDRDDFTVNPTSCSPKQIEAQIRSAQGARSGQATRFQVTDCAALPFRPRLAMRLVGARQVRTGGHPAIRAQVNQRGVGEAGIRRAEVRLPRSLALDVDNAQALCEYEDGTKPDLESHCPRGSIVGRARAVTPLLDRPLAGNVYFVKNIRRDPRTGNVIRTLPMIVAALRGQIAINLVGTSNVKGGKLVSTFAGVPDAPVTRFNLNIAGGRNGILAVTRTRRSLINLCTAGRQVAEADMDGQNGKRRDFNVVMRKPCPRRATPAQVCRGRTNNARQLRACVKRVKQARAKQARAKRAAAKRKAAARRARG